MGGGVNKRVSSRRPEVEGTESGVVTVITGLARLFHRVDPRLRVLKVDGFNSRPALYPSFHRVDPRLRVLKGKDSHGYVVGLGDVSSRRPEVEGTESTRTPFRRLRPPLVSSRRPEVEGTESLNDRVFGVLVCCFIA